MLAHPADLQLAADARDAYLLILVVMDRGSLMLKMLALSMESIAAEGPDVHQGELSLKAVAANAHDARPSGGICN